MKKKLYAILFTGSLMALALLLAPDRLYALTAAAAAGLGLGFLMYKSIAAQEWTGDRNIFDILVSCGIAAAVCAAAGGVFYKTWKKNSIMRVAAAVLHLSRSLFVRLCAGALGLAAFPAAALLIYAMAQGPSQSGSRRSKILRAILCAALAAGLVILQQNMLQYSAVTSLRMMRQMRADMFVINSLALMAFNALLCAVLSSAGSAFIVSTALTFGWSLTNYYVTMFHGSPLFFSEFANARTAASVISGYSFKIDENVTELLRMLFWQAAMAFLLFRNTRKPVEKRKRRIAQTGYAAVAAVFGAVVLLCYNNTAIKPQNVMSWSWIKGVKEYGYVSCIYEDVVKRLDPVRRPEGYSTQAVDEIRRNGSGPRTENYPDIILILNESFYDLGDYTELSTDIDYLNEFYSIEGAHYGRTQVPALGGGTNNSEMELLTSNSMYLLPIYAPFNYLDFTSNKNAFGMSLLDQGYNTAGMHIEKTNYSRHKVYPLIGFQKVLLGEEYFNHYEEYGNRRWTDAGNYKDLIETYLSMGVGPRFIYMLTYQNHGDYETNDATLSRVHTLQSFGDQDHQINEYLTTVSMSADAFTALTEYYKTVDRQVIICMMGDHAPSFIGRLPAKEDMSSQEQEIVRRDVPYVVWANYDIEWQDDKGYTSLVDMGPLLKQAAGLPLSTYDQLILDLHAAAPIRTSSGLYMTADGNYRTYDPLGTDTINEMLRRYYFMEYNLLRGGDDYRPELFEAGASG